MSAVITPILKMTKQVSLPKITQLAKGEQDTSPDLDHHGGLTLNCCIGLPLMIKSIDVMKVLNTDKTGKESSFSFFPLYSLSPQRQKEVKN